MCEYQGSSRRLIFGIQHPADVHFFRNAIRVLSWRGWEPYVFVRAKDIAADLLTVYNIPHTVLAHRQGSISNLATAQLKYEYRMLRAGREIRPAVMVAQVGVAVSHVAPLVGARSLVFLDTEHAFLQNQLVIPFADKICTSTAYEGDIGRKQVRYPYYHELAYLHPDWFEPDPSVLDLLDLEENDPIAVIRLVAWDAAHDVGQQGIDDPYGLVEGLNSLGFQVVISAEGPLPPALESYRATIPIDRMHDLLSCADLYIGESSTMASESSILGTPAIFVGSLDLGYINELEQTYGLAYNLSNKGGTAQALALAEDIATEIDSDEWANRRQRLLTEKVDPTKVIVGEVERMATV